MAPSLMNDAGAFDVNAHVLAFSALLTRAVTLEETRRGFETYPLDASLIPETIMYSVKEPAGLWIGSPTHSTRNRAVYFHGGGYVVGTVSMYIGLASRLAVATRSWIFLADIPLAPEHQFPAAHDAALTASRYVLENGPFNREASMSVFLAGDSCGGGLALATAMRMQGEKHYNGISAVVGLSPTLDLTATSESYSRCATFDKIVSRELTHQCAAMYAPNLSAANPILSPMNGQFTGLPPLLFQVSEDESVFDDSTRAAARACEQGCQVEVQTWRGIPHMWHLLAPFLPSAEDAIAQVGRFIAKARRNGQA